MMMCATKFETCRVGATGRSPLRGHEEATMNDAMPVVWRTTGVDRAIMMCGAKPETARVGTTRDDGAKMMSGGKPDTGASG
jgi:hypothetical protein